MFWSSKNYIQKSKKWASSLSTLLKMHIGAAFFISRTDLFYSITLKQSPRRKTSGSFSETLSAPPCWSASSRGMHIKRWVLTTCIMQIVRGGIWMIGVHRIHRNLNDFRMTASMSKMHRSPNQIFTNNGCPRVLCVHVWSVSIFCIKS